MVVGQWVGFDEDSSGHRIYFPDKQTVSIKCSVKFNTTDMKVYLPQVVSTEGEQEKSLEKQPVQELIDPTDIVDPLGDNFESDYRRLSETCSERVSCH